VECAGFKNGIGPWPESEHWRQQGASRHGETGEGATAPACERIHPGAIEFVDLGFSNQGLSKQYHVKLRSSRKKDRHSAGPAGTRYKETQQGGSILRE
jgi:hypothetical protein